MNLNELLVKIEKRPNLCFDKFDVTHLRTYISGFLFCRSFQEDYSIDEKLFTQNFSEFIAMKLSKEKGNSWDKLLIDRANPWSDFFEMYKEYSEHNRLY